MLCKKDWPALLQTVGEKLSQHVLANYEEFVSGVNEVASVERNLQVGTENPAPATGSLAARLSGIVGCIVGGMLLAEVAVQVDTCCLAWW